MGDYKAGPLAIILLLYFVGVFSIVYYTIQADINNPDLNLDTSGISATDPGFQTEDNPFRATGECSGGSTLSLAFCRYTDAVDNSSCDYIPGCEWDGTDCTGVPNLIDYSGGCNPPMNQTLCELLKCTWTDYDVGGDNTGDTSYSVESSGTTSPLKQTFSIMTGFNADLGIPIYIEWIVRFIFFYIPFILFLWAVYMAIPFFH